MEGERKRITDGFATMERGVMEGRVPTLLSPNQVSRAINTTFRRGFPRNRPPYTQFPLRFEDDEQAEWWATHNVQGRYTYHAPGGMTYPIYSVGGRIFKVDVERPSGINVMELTRADDWNPAVRRHVWMEQAEQYLFIQDGQSVPFIYDGSTLRRSMLGAPRYEIPVGTAMAYGFGRLVVVRPHRRSYVIGDIVHGGTEVYQFTEDNYLNEGGDVTVPIPGEITAVKIISQIDRSTGQGDLMVFTSFGAASARIGEKRSEWKNIQFQLVAMLAAGATSQNSTVLANGDLFFRAKDGIRSVAMTRSEFQNSWSKNPLSREMSVTLGFDTPWLFDFCEATVFDNRLLMLCNQAPLVNGCFHRGLVALDFDLLSSMSEKTPPAYDGLWRGQFTSLMSGDFSTGERCFMTQRNSDGENELWELLKEGVNDDGVPIEWIIEGPSMLKVGFGLRHLQGGDISLMGIIGPLTVQVDYKSDHAPCFNPWYTFSVCAKTRVCDPAEPCVQPINYQPQYRTKKRFPQPPDECSPSDNKPFRDGVEFQPRVTLTGHGAISVFRLHATEIEEPVGEIDGCAPEGDCREEVCCPTE